MRGIILLAMYVLVQVSCRRFARVSGEATRVLIVMRRYLESCIRRVNLAAVVRGKYDALPWGGLWVCCVGGGGGRGVVWGNVDLAIE